MTMTWIRIIFFFFDIFMILFFCLLHLHLFTLHAFLIQFIATADNVLLFFFDFVRLYHLTFCLRFSEFTLAQFRSFCCHFFFTCYTSHNCMSKRLTLVTMSRKIFPTLLAKINERIAHQIEEKRWTKVVGMFRQRNLPFISSLRQGNSLNTCKNEDKMFTMLSRNFTFTLEFSVFTAELNAN